MIKTETETEIKNLALQILTITKEEARLLRFETCYGKVYNFCIKNCKNPEKIVQLIDNIKQKIIDDVMIFDSANIQMLQGIMIYHTAKYNDIMKITDTKHFYKMFQNMNEIVKKKRKIIRKCLTQMHNKRIPEDINNIIYNYI